MKLALNGQWKDISGPIYTYPEKLSGIPDWLASVFDPRNARGLFKASYCYAVWYNNNGYYYSCIKTNTDARNGCVMLTLFAGKMVPSDGVALAEIMRSLLNYCLSKNDPSEIAFVDVSLKAAEIEKLLTPRDLPHDVTVPAAVDKKIAYRLYDNDAELGLFLGNPNQQKYASFKCVLAIEASSFNSDVLATQPLTRITEPIRKTYDIRSKAVDVVVNRLVVEEGSSFDIIYKKTGFIDVPVRVVAGQSCSCCSIEGNVINILSAEAARIIFKCEIVLKVVDEETKSAVKKITCKVDGKVQPNPTKDEEIGYVHLQVDSTKPHNVMISAEGYQGKEFTFAAGERGHKTISLHSLDESVSVRLQLDKKVVSGFVRMKSNNKLYGPLKDVEKDDGTLQVKRPFFSRRNLVPIAVLALAALALGGVLGRFVLRGKTHEEPVVMTDSTYGHTQDSLTKQLADTNNKEEALKLLLYGKTLVQISEVSGKHSKAVIDTLKSEKYKVVLEGKADEEQLNSLIEALEKISGSSQKGNKSGGGNTGDDSKLSKPVMDTLNQHLARNVWDLNYLSKTSKKALSNCIKNGDLNTLVKLSDVDKINTNWKTLREKIVGIIKDQDKKKEFANYMKGKIANGKINLEELLKYFE